MAIDLLIGRDFRLPGWNPNAPQIAVPYDPGQTNRVVRGQSPVMAPQDEPPAPMIDPETGIVHQPHPGMSPESYGPGPDVVPAAPVAPAPDGALTPQQMDEIERRGANPAGAATAPAEGFWSRLARNFQGGGNRIAAPMAGFPASSRYSSTRPEFIFTNPQAAAQAASNYQARLGFESAQDQGYRDYLARLSETQGANERFRQQADSARALQESQLAAAKGEGAATRQSNERIAAMTESVRQHRMEEAQWAENERAAEIGEQTSAMLNAAMLPNADPSAVAAAQKADKRHVFLNPRTGKWEPRFQRRPRPVPPSGLPGVAPASPLPPPPAATMAVPEEAPQAQAPAAPTPESPGLFRRIMGWTTPGMIYNTLTAR
jgi:hypothetical protein